MLFFQDKKSVSVSVCYLILKIGISIAKVKIFKIGKNRFKVNRSIPTLQELIINSIKNPFDYKLGICVIWFWLKWGCDNIPIVYGSRIINI